MDIANRWRDIWKSGSHPEGDGIKRHRIIEESMNVENIRKAHRLRDVNKESERSQFNLINLESKASAKYPKLKNIKLLIQTKYYSV